LPFHVVQYTIQLSGIKAFIPVPVPQDNRFWKDFGDNYQKRTYNYLCMQLSADVLAQFNHLERSGALETLDDLRKENRSLERIITDATLLVSYTDVEAMLGFIISQLLDYFIPRFLVFVIQPPRGKHIRQFCYRNLKKADDTLDEAYYEILRTHFKTNPASISLADLQKALPPDTLGADFLQFEPEIIFPMFGIGGMYGTVILGSKIVDQKYTEQERKYVDRMIRFLSVSMQNGLHYESSITDPKTGLYTHDYYMHRLEEALAHNRRHGTRSGILMLDVDHFKRFNDTWGHVTGDEVLLALSRVLVKTVRTEDCAARFGGEEFSILVTECTPEKLMQVAERIRTAIESLRIPCGESQLSVTVSIGARMVDGLPGISPMILIGDADKALYRSKGSGRNRSTLYVQGLLERAFILRNSR